MPDSVSAQEDLYSRWAELLSSPDLSSRTESSILPVFIGDFFERVLGYPQIPDAGGRFTFSQQQHVEVDGKFADGVIGEFRSGQTPQFLVALEGKGPKDPLDRPFAGRRLSAVEQAYRYATNLPCDWILVTNIREVRLYHKGTNQRTYERFDMLRVCQEPGELARFVFVLSAAHVIPESGFCHLYGLLEASQHAEQELTRTYYTNYAEIRRKLVDDIRHHNPALPTERLLSTTQKILDRVLFCSFCEDRGLLPPETLKRAYEHGDPYNPRPIWENFRGLFRAIDEGQPALSISRYNGGLFAHDPEVDDAVVSDDSCALFKALGDYDYSVPDHLEEGEEPTAIVDVEVLGHIFEQSISELEELHAELESGEPVSRGRRHREGVFYTPAFITRFIVDRALAPVLAERFEALRSQSYQAATSASKSVLRDPRVYDLESIKPSQRRTLERFWEDWLETLKSIRVVDPACGSGAFLIEAFDRLYAEYEEIRERLEEFRSAQMGLFDPDREILTNNLFGVDISDEAIQICRLSIWIKTAQHGKLLNELDRNFRVGNSVVGDPAVDERALDWRTAFDQVFADGGFDVVVGNPPYVRQELIADSKPYLEGNYATYHGAADLFVYFYELGIRLLRPGGRLSYVVTNKWLKSGYAEPLREFFHDQAWVREVVDFGHAKQIFPDADVLPVILVAQRPDESSPPAETSICVIPRDELKIDDLESQASSRAFSVPREALGRPAWQLEPPEVRELMEQLTSENDSLAAVLGAEPSWGIKTGFNAAFLVDTATRDSIIREDPSSEKLLKPYLRGQDVRTPG